jgi:hypothetical protein
MGELFYRRMFLTGALWNLLGGIVLIIFAPWIFGTAGLVPPHPPLFFHSWIALFMTFGIGYYMVSRNPYPNKNVVVLGMVGKLAFSVIFVWNLRAFEGDVPPVFLIAVVGDLVFVILFGKFLGFARSQGK